MGSGHFLKGQVLPLFLFPSWSLLVGNNRLPHLSYGLQIPFNLEGVLNHVGERSEECCAGDNHVYPALIYLLLGPWGSLLLQQFRVGVPAQGLRPDLMQLPVSDVWGPHDLLLDECNIMGDVSQAFFEVYSSNCNVSAAQCQICYWNSIASLFMPYISYLSNGDCRISLNPDEIIAKITCVLCLERLWIFYLIKQNFNSTLFVYVCVLKFSLKYCWSHWESKFGFGFIISVIEMDFSHFLSATNFKEHEPTM